MIAYTILCECVSVRVCVREREGVSVREEKYVWKTERMCVRVFQITLALIDMNN